MALSARACPVRAQISIPIGVSAVQAVTVAGLYNRRLSLRWFEPNTCHTSEDGPLTSRNAVRGSSRARRLYAAPGGHVRLAVPIRAKSGEAVGHARLRLCRPLPVVLLVVTAVWLWFVAGLVRLGCFEDSPLRLVLLSRDALGVDARQHVDAVALPGSWRFPASG